MTCIYFSFHISSFNPIMLTNTSNKLSSSWNCCNSSPYMNLFWGSFSNSSWWYVISPLLSYACRPSSYIREGYLGCSIWSDALLCLTEKFQWYRRTHRIYLPNYFSLVCHPLGGRYFPWSVLVKLGSWPFQTWLLGRVTGWCCWLLSHYQWRPWPGSW